MNENDDVMGFNDEPPVTSGIEPENIPDSAYESETESNHPEPQQTIPDEYAGFEGWEAETDDNFKDNSYNLTASSNSENEQFSSDIPPVSDDNTEESSPDNTEVSDEEVSQAKKLQETNPSEKVDISQKNKNKGMFLRRQKILMIFAGIFVFFIIFFTFVFPVITEKKKKEEAKELDKAGKQYIPSVITTEIEEKPDFTDGNSALVQPEEDLGDKYPPLVEEEKPVQNTAPVQIPAGSSNTTSTVPLTNRNEQQKQPQRLSLEDVSSPTEAEAKKKGAYYPTTMPQGYNTGYKGSGQNTSGQSYMPDALTQNINKMISSQSQMYGGSSYQMQNNQSAKQEFLNKNGIGGNFKWNAEYSLWKGTIITVVLDTGINTDLPGQLMGHVTKNVFSSQDGTYLLIPQGSRLFGEYSSDISYGQSRIQVVWNTLIRPDGLEVNLGSMNGIDAYGASGYKGWKTEHPFEYLKAFGLIAAYSILDTKAMNLIDTQNNQYAQNALSDVYSETKKLNNKIVDRALDIQPTIRIPSGTEVNLITNVTIDLPPLERYEVEEKYVRY